jgi:hypothetical protein
MLQAMVVSLKKVCAGIRDVFEVYHIVVDE